MKADRIIKDLRIWIAGREIKALNAGAELFPDINDFDVLEQAGKVSISFSGTLKINPEAADRLRKWHDASVAEMAADIAKHRAAWLASVIEILRRIEGISDDVITIAEEGRSTIVSVNGEPRCAWRYTLEGEKQP